MSASLFPQRLNDRELATVVAALGLYRHFLISRNYLTLGDEVMTIASDSGKFEPLDEEEIDALVPRIQP